MRLSDWWRCRRWRALLELIIELPHASRFYEARNNDPEFALEVAKTEREREQEGKPRPPWRPAARDWSLEAQLLREIREAVIAVRNATIRVAGGNPKTIRPIPSPRTAIDEAREELSKQGQLEIISIFAPHAMKYADLSGGSK